MATKEFREKINVIIYRNGLKKSHVAKQIGISSIQLSQYLHGSREMPVEVETKLRNYFKI